MRLTVSATASLSSPMGTSCLAAVEQTSWRAGRHPLRREQSTEFIRAGCIGFDRMWGGTLAAFVRFRRRCGRLSRLHEVSGARRAKPAVAGEAIVAAAVDEERGGRAERVKDRAAGHGDQTRRRPDGECLWRNGDGDVHGGGRVTLAPVLSGSFFIVMDRARQTMRECSRRR